MSNYPTDKLTSVFAVNGDKRLPPSTAALAGSGRASQYEGFKIENSMPLSQGGIPPFREDFNGIFNLFSQFLLWYQQGGVMQYDSTLDYEVNNEVYYNGLKYRCIQDNGVSSTVALPMIQHTGKRYIITVILYVTEPHSRLPMANRLRLAVTLTLYPVETSTRL
jgi:hypothetical protein